MNAVALIAFIVPRIIICVVTKEWVGLEQHR